jgi:hypothetical protein
MCYNKSIKGKEIKAMKTVCDFRQIVKLDKEEFDTSFRRHLCYEEPRENVRSVDTFEELVEIVSNDLLYNATVGTTFFGKKIVTLFKADLYDSKRKITEKNFKPFVIIQQMKEDTRKNSFNTLMELLSAEDFAEWCKDHGITTICK